jgi:thioredoxin reductase (NADPH)
MGPDLIEQMRKQAQRFGAEFRAGAVVDVDLSRRPFQVKLAKETLEARTLIVASGASARLLGIESERRLIGHGVSTCATCDGFFFRAKDIAVVGGGDTAMEEAVFLTRFAKRVHLIHRRNDFRASKIMLERARANDKIHFVTPAVIDEVLDVSNGSVEGLRMRNPDTQEKWVLPVDGVFVAIGHEPNTKMFRGQLETNASGYLVTREGSSQTNVEGVFAAGDVKDHRYRQAVTAAGSGCMAAIDAEKFLEAEQHSGHAWH